MEVVLFAGFILGVCGRKVGPAPLSHTKTQHTPVASYPYHRYSPHTNKFLSKKVNFMADLRRKYVCRSAVALVETHSFGVPFPFSGA